MASPSLLSQVLAGKLQGGGASEQGRLFALERRVSCARRIDNTDQGSFLPLFAAVAAVPSPACPLSFCVFCQRTRKQNAPSQDPIDDLRRKAPSEGLNLVNMDTLGIDPRAFRMRGGCDTATPCAQLKTHAYAPLKDAQHQIPRGTQSYVFFSLAGLAQILERTRRLGRSSRLDTRTQI